MGTKFRKIANLITGNGATRASENAERIRKMAIIAAVIGIALLA